MKIFYKKIVSYDNMLSNWIFDEKRSSPSLVELRGEYGHRRENYTICGTALSGEQLEVSGGAICKSTKKINNFYVLV